MSRQPRTHAGLTIIEVVMASVVLAALASASLSLVGASAAAKRVGSQRERAHWLARELLNEVLDAAYVDPEDPGATPGIDAGEASGDDRTLYDDVDDYTSLADDPAAGVDGAPVAGLTGWSRSVQVVWVSPNDIDTPSVAETDLRRITVRTSFNGADVIELVGLRARAGQP